MLGAVLLLFLLCVVGVVYLVCFATIGEEARPRFSLRDLLIAMTLIAVLLAAAAMIVR